MTNPSKHRSDPFPVGVGYYTVAEAARLLRFPALKLRRWLRGYDFKARNGERQSMPPLWRSELPTLDDRLELSFQDLVNLRYVGAFLGQGVSLQTVRLCIERAREITGDDRPFSTLGFRTDGRRIFMQVSEEIPNSLLDLKLLQYVMKQIVEPSFRDFDYDERRVIKWRLSPTERQVVIDPEFAFGQPIIETASIPTSVLDDAVRAEGTERRVAQLYELNIAQVRQAVRFEQGLRAA